MDPSTMHDLWIQLATNSPFLAFVMYNWYKMTQQNEEYRKEIKSDREQYERKREESIEKIRERYAQVIEQLKQERENYRLEKERIREKCEQEKNQLIQGMDRKIDRIIERQ